MENLEKCKICDINVNKIVLIFQQIFLSRVTQGKFVKIPWKSQGKFREFKFLKNVATLMLDYFLKYPYKLIPVLFSSLEYF